MKKIGLLVLLIMCLSLVLIGCESDDNEQALKDIINKNIEALNNEDVDLYMSTISEESAVYAQTEQAMNQMFEAYDLEAEIEDIKIIEIEDDTAKVEVTQTTKKVSGPEFQDNRVTAVHTLKKHEDGWKFVSTEMKSMDVLE